MKFIIIGAKGLAGSAFLRVLKQLGHQCIPVDIDNYNEAVGSEGDVLINADGNSVKHLASKDPIGEIKRSVSPVMRTCKDFVFNRYVLLSSADVYTCQSDPQYNSEDTKIEIAKLSTYGLCKYMAECIIINRCRHYLILRLGGLLGPGLKKNPLYDLLTGSKIFVHPDSKFGYILTDDVARITIHLLNVIQGNEIYNVCGDGLVSIKQLIQWTHRDRVDFPESAKPINYNINIKELKRYYKIPKTWKTVNHFIDWWKHSEKNK